MLPKNLVLIRHGQSELNQIIYKLRHNHLTQDEVDISAVKCSGSKWRLTNLGRFQAQIAGTYIRNNLGIDNFDGFYVSDFVRAKETAALLQLENAQWKVEPYLRERDWGEVSLQDYVNRCGTSAFKEKNAFYGTPINGESMATVCLRVDRMLDTLHREHSNNNVIIVCHGELMWGFRARLERLLENEFVDLDKSKNSHDRIHNCQILHYKRENSSSYLTHMRNICPWDTNLSSNTWKKIERKKYSNDELLQEVHKEALFFNEQ